MATYTAAVGPENANDTQFRAWASALSAGFAAVGLVQTADTGQIDLEAATRPAANQSAGYEIWRFDDEEQAVAPIFIKIQYGCATNSGARIWLSLGSGSNGSGSLTGASVTSELTSGGLSIASPSEVSDPLTYVCKREGVLVGLMSTSQASPGAAGASHIYFTIERLYDPTGNLIPDSGAVAAGGHPYSSVTLGCVARVGATAISDSSSTNGGSFVGSRASSRNLGDTYYLVNVVPAVDTPCLPLRGIGFAYTANSPAYGTSGPVDNRPEDHLQIMAWKASAETGNLPGPDTNHRIYLLTEDRSGAWLGERYVADASAVQEVAPRRIRGGQIFPRGDLRRLGTPGFATKVMGEPLIDLDFSTAADLSKIKDSANHANGPGSAARMEWEAGGFIKMASGTDSAITPLDLPLLSNLMAVAKIQIPSSATSGNAVNCYTRGRTRSGGNSVGVDHGRGTSYFSYTIREIGGSSTIISNPGTSSSSIWGDPIWVMLLLYGPFMAAQLTPTDPTASPGSSATVRSTAWAPNAVGHSGVGAGILGEHIIGFTGGTNSQLIRLYNWKVWSLD